MYPDNQVYKYIDQLEKRVLEQEQLIALLNEKILSLKSTPQVNQPNAADVRCPTSCNVPPRDQNMDQMSFVGTRKSDVPSVTTTKYNQYFVSRTNFAYGAMNPLPVRREASERPSDRLIRHYEYTLRHSPNAHYTLHGV
ncbi:hypothetical protein M8J75_005522 [Diaphorina citri]|nr:hypothetical protein M8J75_005522 [Diaphorina citri]